MKVEAMVMAEDVQVRDGVEYVSVTCMEVAAEPLLQMFDYGLREDERMHKGKLVGKQISLRWNTVRSIFSGRPQIVGRLLSVNGANGK